jgi:hypothetical protein
MLLAGLVAAAYATSVSCGCGRRKPGPCRARGGHRGRPGPLGAQPHVAVAVAGAALLLAEAGAATGLGYGLRAGSAGTQVARMTGAAMARLPSALVLASVAVFLVGLCRGRRSPGRGPRSA